MGLFCLSQRKQQKAIRHFEQINETLGGALIRYLFVLDPRLVEAAAKSALDEYLVKLGIPVDTQNLTPAVIADRLKIRTAEDDQEANQTFANHFNTTYGMTKIASTYKSVLMYMSGEVVKEWPLSRAGVIFVWQNFDASGVNYAESFTDNEQIVCKISHEGSAGRDSGGALNFRRGIAFATDQAERILTACQKTNALTIEALIAPRDLHPREIAPVISCSTGPTSRNFTLYQDRDSFVFRLRTTDNSGNADLQEIRIPGLRHYTAPYHIILSYEPGELFCWLNGKAVDIPGDKLRGTFATWSAMDLMFGNEFTQDQPWHGSIQNIAIYSRAFNASEAASQYELITN